MSDTSPPLAENYVMPFGVHQGKTLSQILQDDAKYFDWLNSINIQSNKLREAVAVICEKYAPEIERALDL